MSRFDAEAGSSAPAAQVREVGPALGRAAHDLNNLCASMLGFAALSQESLAADSPVQPYLSEIQRAAEQAAALSGHLRELARQLGPAQGRGA